MLIKTYFISKSFLILFSDNINFILTHLYILWALEENSLPPAKKAVTIIFHKIGIKNNVTINGNGYFRVNIFINIDIDILFIFIDIANSYKNIRNIGNN